MPSDVINYYSTTKLLPTARFACAIRLIHSQDDSELNSLTRLVKIVWSLIGNYYANEDFIKVAELRTFWRSFPRGT